VDCIDLAQDGGQLQAVYEFGNELVSPIIYGSNFLNSKSIY
jgi:hypothetical protein